MALRLHNEVPGISVPEPVLAMPCATPVRTRPRPGSRSRASCSRRCAGRVAGVYVIPPFKQPEAALDLLLG